MSEQVSASTSVHLVYIRPSDGKKGWLASIPRVVNGRLQAPPIDDDPRESLPLRYELAVIAARRYREELSLAFRLALEPQGRFIDDDLRQEASLPQHQGYWYAPQDDEPDTGYLIRAVCRPEGKQFALFFRNPILAAQTVYVDQSEGPFACIQQAYERGYLQHEPPYEHPQAEHRRVTRQAEKEKQERQQHIAQVGRLQPRPGDITR